MDRIWPPPFRSRLFSGGEIADGAFIFDLRCIFLLRLHIVSFVPFTVVPHNREGNALPDYKETFSTFAIGREKATRRSSIGIFPSLQANVRAARAASGKTNAGTQVLSYQYDADNTPANLARFLLSGANDTL